MNNECDPITNWSQVHSWRAPSYYPGFCLKLIHQHQYHLVEQSIVSYALLSSDNAFCGPWGFRTLLARFGKDEDVSEGLFEMVKKPILQVFELLSRMGDTILTGPNQPFDLDDIGILATYAASSHAAIAVYHHNDRIQYSSCACNELNLNKIPFNSFKLVHYRIDSEHGAPFYQWQKVGPYKATREWLDAMRKHYLRANTLKTWKNFEILCASADEDEEPADEEVQWRMVNEGEIISTCFLHARDPFSSPMRYKIRVVDFWNRKRAESEEIRF